jgi:hypothetical protein
MDIEVKESKESAIAADDELAHALNESLKPDQSIEKKETVIEEKKPLPSDHAERSEFGRKANERLQEISETNKSLLAANQALLDRLDALESRLQKPEKREETVTDDEPEIISTAEDVRRVNQIDRRKRQELVSSWGKNYTSSFRQLGKSDELYQEVYDEMMKNFNICRLTAPESEGGVPMYSPEVDAELNYEKAKNAILQRKYGQKKVPVRDKQDGIPTDLGVESKEITEEDTLTKLDPLADDFVRSVGMSSKSIKEALR